MAGILGKLKWIIGADTQPFEKGLKNTESKSKAWSNRMQSNIVGAMKRIGGAIAAAFAVQKITQFATESVKLAAEAEGVVAAFKKLNKPTLLKDLRKAVQGTISDVELMKQAVRASNFKVPLNQLATFFEFATKRAAQTGESVDYLVGSIIDGIGRKSTLVMDNLGISATELQAEIKKVGDFGEAAGNIIAREMGKMGDVALTSAQRFQQLQAQTANLQAELGKELTPIINKLTSAAINAVKALGMLLDTDYEKAMRVSENAVNQFRVSLEQLFSSKSFTQAQNIEAAAMALGQRLGKVNKELTAEKATLEKLKSLRLVPEKDIKRHEERIRVLRDTMSLYKQMYIEVLKGVGIIKEETKAEQDVTEVIEKGNRALEERIELKEREQAVSTVKGTGGLNTDASELYGGMPDFLEDMDNLAILGNMVNNLFDDMAANDPFKAMGDSLKALILQLIQALVIASILSALTGGATSIGSFFGGLTGLNIPGFAEGGIVTGPTLAMIGEKPGSRGEAVIPLEKMDQVFGGMNSASQGGKLVAVVSGTDLKFILDRTNQNFNRFN